MDQSAAPWHVIEEPATPQERSGGPDPRSGRGGPAWRVVPILSAGAAAILAVAAVAVAAGSHPAVEVTGALAVSDSPPGSAGEPPRSGGAPRDMLVVDVQGAVAHAGVVRLPAGSRVGDAIAAAGGYGPRVAAERLSRALNLAALLKDGDQVVVPSRDDVSASPGTGSSGSSPGAGSSGGAGGSGPVELNRATAAELDALPGIGPVTATKIIASRDERPFASVDDLRSRKLVGAATFDKIKAFIVVR